MLRAFIVLTVIFGGIAPSWTGAIAQTPYGSCSQRAQYYQDRYEANGQMSDLVCMQKAMQRDMADNSGYSCPNSAQSYQTAYEATGRFDDLVCMQKALEREFR